MTTYYVRKNGPGTGGLTPATAYPTIAGVQAVLQNNDTVIVGSGSYAESITSNSKTGVSWIGDYDGLWVGGKGQVTVTDITATKRSYFQHINLTGDLISAVESTYYGGSITGSVFISDDPSFKLYSAFVGGVISVINPIDVVIDSCTISTSTAPLTITQTEHGMRSLKITNSILRTSSATSYFISTGCGFDTITSENNVFWRTNGRQDRFAIDTTISLGVSGLPEWQLSGNDQESSFVDPGLVGYTVGLTSPVYSQGETALAMDISGSMRGEYTEVGCYHIPRVKELPACFPELRFRYQYPLGSDKITDTLSFFQQFLAYYFGAENYELGRLTDGLVPRTLREIKDRDETREDLLEIPQEKLDSIIGNLNSLRTRKW